MTAIHKNLATGEWNNLTLMEQLGNIGSEVSRAALSQGKDEGRFQGAVQRGLDLFDLTLADSRWKGPSLEDLDRYFLPFAVAARQGK